LTNAHAAEKSNLLNRNEELTTELAAANREIAKLNIQKDKSSKLSNLNRTSFLSSSQSSIDIPASQNLVLKRVIDYFELLIKFFLKSFENIFRLTVLISLSCFSMSSSFLSFFFGF